MRYYDIFLIEDDVARFYFGQEVKLYQLFLEARTIDNLRIKKEIDKQIDYITKPMPVNAIQQRISMSCRHYPGYDCRGYIHIFQCTKGGSRAKLEVQPSGLTLQGIGDYTAEATFFEVLRQIDSSFLAIDFHLTNFGWLKPIRNAHLI
ncbi:uncharacterized protein DUF2522 [Scopulibacillus darangshiensis]|uniref:Uncharacterized protein DUF2522 n=1 Tax=Scopulibacillus darangshiensis TaxID=442528 RepID=A0A4R2P5U0_9BACL|nr:sporulation inhibitor of replication protein SirA [Scopulibacillus darangshiensis]TCP30230.1 uncharacterized protein DUF2522 [Scopulibacillus darangshiensis]